MNIRVEQDRLRRHLEIIIGERSAFSGRAHLSQVECYVESEFRSFGLALDDDLFSYRGESWRNIIGWLGKERGKPLIVLGAHIDSVEGTPGADDNASGVAVLLEAARLLASVALDSPIVCCAFNLEELNMIGSGAFATKLHAGGSNLAAMISLEMVGYKDARPGSQRLPPGLARFYPDRGDFIGVIGNWHSRIFQNKFAAAMREVPGLPVETLSVPGRGALIPAVRLSDHAPFWDLGYAALMVTDTSFYRNPNYHGHGDTLATLDIDFMAKVCAGVVRGVQRLATL